MNGCFYFFLFFSPSYPPETDFLISCWLGCIGEFVAGYIPSILDIKLLDEVVKVNGKIYSPSVVVNLPFYFWSDKPVWAYSRLLFIIGYTLQLFAYMI
jgi:hypothetical protein